MARTANRETNNAVSPYPQNTMRWNLAKYIRLSKEDLNRGHDDSNSVVNQKRLLDDYYKQHIDEVDRCLSDPKTIRIFQRSQKLSDTLML